MPSAVNRSPFVIANICADQEVGIETRSTSTIRPTSAAAAIH